MNEVIAMLGCVALEGHATTVSAQFVLGKIHEMGHGLKADNGEALRYYGDVLRVLEKCLCCGELVTPSTQARSGTCEHACHEACARSLREWGVEEPCMACASSVASSKLEAVPRLSRQDFEDATRDYVSLEQRVLHGQATWERLGLRDQANMDSAIATWCRLAKGGLKLAQFILGFVYEHGHGIEASDAEAVSWYHKAASTSSRP